MDRVLDRLFIGDSHDLSGATPLAALGFGAVLDLRDGERAELPGVKTLRIKNRDGSPWNKAQVATALDFIAEWIRTGRVLVACAAGMSRSASMVIGYLVRCGWSVPEAHEHVRRIRPEIAPAPSMLACAVEAAAESP